MVLSHSQLSIVSTYCSSLSTASLGLCPPILSKNYLLYFNCHVRIMQSSCFSFRNISSLPSRSLESKFGGKSAKAQKRTVSFSLSKPLVHFTLVCASNNEHILSSQQERGSQQEIQGYIIDCCRPTVQSITMLILSVPCSIAPLQSCVNFLTLKEKILSDWKSSMFSR